MGDDVPGCDDGERRELLRFGEWGDSISHAQGHGFGRRRVRHSSGRCQLHNHGDTAMRKALLLLAVVSSAWGQTKLFSTGMESASTMGAIPGTMQAGSNSLEQQVTGVDASTSYNWSTLWGLYGANAGLTGFHLIPGNGMDGQAFSAAFQNAFTTAQAHSGSQSLLVTAGGFSNPNCSGACGQDTWNIVGTLNVTEHYQRYWLFIPTSQQTLLQGQGSAWQMFFEFKSSNNHRLGTYVYRNAGSYGGQLYFHSQSDDLTDAHGLTTTYWTQDVDPASVPVPINQWFMMEVYFKLSSGSDGRYFWAMTDPSGVKHVLVDKPGANFAASTSGEYIHGLYLLNSYGSNWPITRYVDDFEVWNTAPCGTSNLPCGPASSGPVAPTITTASLPNGTVGVAYSQTLTATGDKPITWDVSSGSLAACNLSLASNGAITGTPTTAGTCNFTARATNAAGNNTKALSIVVPDPTAPLIVNQTFCTYGTFPASCTIPAVTAGNLLAIEFGTLDTAGTATVMSNITDNATGGSNTYAQCYGARSINTLQASGYWSDIWTGVAMRGGATSSTITPSASLSGAALVLEIANVNSCAGAARNSQTATAAPSGASVTTSATKGIALSYLHAAPGASIAGVTVPFTSDLISTDWAWAHYVFSSAGTYTPQWTQSSATYASSSAVLTSGTGTGSQDFWITQNGAGSKNGSSLANAAACDAVADTPQSTCAAFNTAGNWGTGAAQIGAGTTVHLSGTITAANGAVHYLQFQGSGTSGNPITLKFETGALLTALYWGSNNSDGVINLNGKSFLTIDGGTNGTIQATGNGTAGSTKCINGSCAQLAGQGVFILGDGSSHDIEIRNLTMKNLYVHDPSVNANDTFAPHDANQGIQFWRNGGVNDWSIHDNKIYYASWSLSGWGNNIDIYNNDLGWTDHCIAIGPSANHSGMYFHGNHCHDPAVWDSTSAEYHHDGIHRFPSTTGVVTTGLYIYNNVFDGAWGVNITGPLFTEGSLDQVYLFNNFMTFSDTTNDGTGMFAFSPNSSAVISNTFVANNTWMGNTKGLCMHWYPATTGVTFANNLVMGCTTLVEFDATGNTFTATGMTNNIYQNVGNPIFHYGSNTTNSLATWRSLTGQDANSIIDSSSNIKVGSDGKPLAGSLVINGGMDLSSMCTGRVAALCQDLLGASRLGAWGVGAYQYASSGGMPPTITTSSPLPASTVSAAYSQTISATGDATITWAISGAPAWMTGCNGATGASCTLSGTPATAATLSIQLTATNTAGNNSKMFSLTINAVPSIATNTLPAAVRGSWYSQTLGTSGGTGAVSCTLTSGSLPPGLTLSGCTISGTAAGSGSDFGFSITPSDTKGVPGAAQPLTIHVSDPVLGPAYSTVWGGSGRK